VPAADRDQRVDAQGHHAAGVKEQGIGNREQ
jgi:hypothetical protein